jgi:hypothetical protein
VSSHPSFSCGPPLLAARLKQNPQHRLTHPRLLLPEPMVACFLFFVAPRWFIRCVACRGMLRTHRYIRVWFIKKSRRVFAVYVPIRKQRLFKTWFSSLHGIHRPSTSESSPSSPFSNPSVNHPQSTFAKIRNQGRPFNGIPQQRSELRRIQ